MDLADVIALVITFPIWFAFVLMAVCIALMVFMIVVEVVAIVVAFVVAMILVAFSPLIYTMQYLHHSAPKRFEPMRPVVIVVNFINLCAEKPEVAMKAIEGKIKK